ncbi:uncharacterized protein LOC103876717 [Papio anubis]|uniref:uncharacterized protein LOC103876717 n=1 Tax=Papio anubis TaxID=9555 RepID=UPI0012AE8AD5|nr:uncharacterized protein LOC103876717 [Papio anubis]
MAFFPDTVTVSCMWHPNVAPFVHVDQALGVKVSPSIVRLKNAISCVYVSSNQKISPPQKSFMHKFPRFRLQFSTLHEILLLPTTISLDYSDKPRHFIFNCLYCYWIPLFDCHIDFKPDLIHTWKRLYTCWSSTHLERPHSPAFSPGTSSHGLLLGFPVPRPQAHQAARASRRPRTGQQVAPGLHGRSPAARRAPREVASERGRCASAAATRGPGANVASGARQGLGRARVAPRSRPHCFRPGTLLRAVRADYARVPVTEGRAWGRRLRPSRRRGRGRVGTSARFPPRRAGVGQGRGWRQVAGTWGTGPRVAWGGEPPPRPSERPPGMMINHTTAPRWPRQSPVPGAAPSPARVRRAIRAAAAPQPPPSSSGSARGGRSGSGRGDARTPRWRRPNTCSAPGEPQNSPFLCHGGAGKMCRA